MKRCPRCKRILDNNAFCRNRNNPDGLNLTCKECKNSARRKGPKPIVSDEQMRARYRKVRVNGKQMPLHRRIMELFLGRSLSDDEVVHHVNGNRLDNRPENLALMSVSEHSRLENLGRKPSEETRKKLSAKLMGNQHLKGHFPSAETRAKLSAALKGNKNQSAKRNKH